MPNFNQLTCIGHVGRDAEQSFTPNGKSMLKFSVAMQSGWGDKKATTWLNVTKWNPPEWMAARITRGSAVLVQGEFTLREYDARDGSKKQSADLNAQTVVPMEHGDAAAGKQRHLSSGVEQAHEITDDDIPF